MLQSLATVEPDATVRRAVERIESALYDAAPDLDLVLQHGRAAAGVEAGATLQPWRPRVLAVDDALLERRTTVAATSKRLAAAVAAERENILVRIRTFDYVERDPRPFLLRIACGIVIVLALRALIVGAGGDYIVPPEHAYALRRHWSEPPIHWCSGSHVAPFPRARLVARVVTHLDALVPA
ncbi:MAG: hypothetical protein B6D46_16450 [Polyangiaceae bacterium UTPRO1]|nr:hypothetical protein [Myxococcales bacterium]OQY64541.1 MAG: hypothetical protein B6D46_16450 [Polyangiaceae bacterium UTPRO1]